MVYLMIKELSPSADEVKCVNVHNFFRLVLCANVGAKYLFFFCLGYYCDKLSHEGHE